MDETNKARMFGVRHDCIAGADLFTEGSWTMGSPSSAPALAGADPSPKPVPQLRKQLHMGLKPAPCAACMPPQTCDLTLNLAPSDGTSTLAAEGAAFASVLTSTTAASSLAMDLDWSAGQYPSHNPGHHPAESFTLATEGAAYTSVPSSSTTSLAVNLGEGRWPTS